MKHSETFLKYQQTKGLTRIEKMRVIANGLTLKSKTIKTDLTNPWFCVHEHCDYFRKKIDLVKSGKDEEKESEEEE